MRWGFQRREYVWKALVGSNQRWNCCSLSPFPWVNTLVWSVYGSPEEFPKNSKSISSWLGPWEDNCMHKIFNKPWAMKWMKQKTIYMLSTLTWSWLAERLIRDTYIISSDSASWVARNKLDLHVDPTKEVLVLRLEARAWSLVEWKCK